VLAVLVFAVTLLVAVLLSELAHRTILSAAVLFLVAGFVVGGGWARVLELRPTDHVVGGFAELALFSILFSILFTDGMRVGLKDLVSAWRLQAGPCSWGSPSLCSAPPARPRPDRPRLDRLAARRRRAQPDRPRVRRGHRRA
jgi:sodium/hydrogen antiporter